MYIAHILYCVAITSNRCSGTTTDGHLFHLCRRQDRQETGWTYYVIARLVLLSCCITWVWTVPAFTSLYHWSSSSSCSLISSLWSFISTIDICTKSKDSLLNRSFRLSFLADHSIIGDGWFAVFNSMGSIPSGKLDSNCFYPSWDTLFLFHLTVT